MFLHREIYISICISTVSFSFYIHTQFHSRLFLHTEFLFLPLHTRFRFHTQIFWTSIFYVHIRIYAYTTSAEERRPSF